MSAGVFARPYPVVLNLDGQRVLVVGAGPVGWHKATGLADAGAAVTIVAPTAIAEIREDPRFRWHAREYRRGEAASYRLVITATNAPEVNAQVARDGQAANVFVNSADDPANCEFTLPSVVQRGDLQVAVSTNGRSPAFARWLRAEIERSVNDQHVGVLDVLSEVRAEAKARMGTSEVHGWSAAIDEQLFALVADGNLAAARDRVRRAIGLTSAVDGCAPTTSTHPTTPTGVPI